MTPEHLKPNPALDESLETHVAIEEAPERDISMENANRALTTLGMGSITSDKMMALRELGIQAKAQGILNRMQGSVVIGQQGFVDISAKLQALIDGDSLTAKELREVAKVMGYLWGQVAKLNSSTVKAEAVVVQAAADVDRRRRASFPPGQVINLKSAKAP